jgi:HD-GYP domain-containing protein (c-di-GMP phosphodiesterase class II)/DNA-binding CsgD family transcriptional regulator
MRMAMIQNSSTSSNIRLAELMLSLSIATDLGMGQPLEFALQTCVLAIRLGEKLGLGEAELRQVYYQALLRYIGCNSDTHLLAAIVGDELAMRTDAIHLESSGPEILNLIIQFIRQTHAGEAWPSVLRAVAGGMNSMAQITPEFFGGHCEVAGRLAQRLGFDTPTVSALSQVYARWDGKGIPALKGEAIAPSLLVVSLAQDMTAFYRLKGTEAAIAIAKKRKGTLYAPKQVECFCRYADELLAGFEEAPGWETVLALEPGARRFLSPIEFDTACAAIADYADIKSPYTLGHSPAVAGLAALGARNCGLPETDAVTLRHAGLLHDAGRVGVSAGIWSKPGPLSDREWEKVRLYPYYTERILARPNDLARLGTLAAHHHERLDGSGYHRGAGAASLSPAARLLAAADVYQALTETRPHRPAWTPEAAADQLRLEVRQGKLDGEAVNGVLAAAGHHVSAGRKEFVAGLSEREVEVLRLLARGNSIKQIAQVLVVSPKTVDNHIQHIYGKIGVTTRAGAALFATENDLLG